MHASSPFGVRASLLLASALALAAAAFAEGPSHAKKPEAASALVERGAYTLLRPAGWSEAAGASPRVDLTLACDADPGVNISIATAPAGATRDITEREAAEAK